MITRIRHSVKRVTQNKILIPAFIRELLNIRNGDYVRFIITDDKVHLEKHPSVYVRVSEGGKK